MFNSVFEKFVKDSPISVMARTTMERAFNPNKIDEWFSRTALVQYTEDLLFSSVFDLMSSVVAYSYPSVHAACQHSQDVIGVSVTSVYNKLNGIETGTSAGPVRYAADESAPVITELDGTQDPRFPGYQVKLSDGNRIEAGEHRIRELREPAAGVPPGKSQVVYDPVKNPYRCFSVCGRTCPGTLSARSCISNSARK
ncbi:hypothetical protein QUF75_12715 [Desulfococcaceae bacterium HSG7]|nr:hypothetical protein [Desulfococcaceae bacterium HSG7]